MNTLRVLTYHRVDEIDKSAAFNALLISATPDAFDEQMSFLANNYAVLSAEEVLRISEGNGTLPRKAVMVTFDDAYRDVGEIAWPILVKHGIPATVFVPTAYVTNQDLHFWWDSLYRSIWMTSEAEISLSQLGTLSLSNRAERRAGLRTLMKYAKGLSGEERAQFLDNIAEDLNSESYSGKNGILSWTELRELAHEGLALGAHTQTHSILTNLAPAKVKQEVEGSLADLKQNIGEALPIFAYPNGNFNDSITNIVRSAGIKLAFTTLGGFNDLSIENRLRIRRINITPRSTRHVFRFRLSKIGIRFDMLRK